MFNFFRKEEPQDVDSTEDEVLASITYLIKRDSKNALIDVQLINFENECVEALSSLLEILGNDSFYIDTIHMIRSSLTKEGKYEVLANVLSKLEYKIREKIISSARDRIKDEPCIKPSEMFK